MRRKNEDRAAAVRHVPAKASAIVLVCRKCSKKLDGGFGAAGDERLAKALRRLLGRKEKPLRASAMIVEVGCLDLCPRDAVVVLRGDYPDDWLVVPRGLPVEQIAGLLGLQAARSEAEA